MYPISLIISSLPAASGVSGVAERMCPLWKTLSLIHYPHYVRNFSINRYHQSLRFFSLLASAFSIFVAVFLGGRVNIAVPDFSV